MKKLLIFIPITLLVSCYAPLAVVNVDGKQGCINKRGKIIIKPIWDDVSTEDNKYFSVEKDGLYGFINRRNKVIISPRYTYAEDFCEGLATVESGDKYGAINKKGDTIIPIIYDDIFAGFTKGLGAVTKNDSSGYINKKGKVVIPLIYETTYPFLSKYAQVVTFSGDYLIINKKGKVVDKKKVGKKRLWPPLDSYPGSFTTSTGRGRLNAKGDTIIPPLYRATGNFYENRSIVQDQNNKWGVYDDKGNLIVKPTYDNILHYSEGLTAVQLNGKYGYIDLNGKTVVEHLYDYAESFNNNRAYVELNGKGGYINRKGEVVIPFKFRNNNKGGRFN
jgi:WG containing repeat